MQEARLASERDAARKEAAALREERGTLAAMVQQLEASTHDMSAELQTERAKASSAAQAAGRHQVRMGRRGRRALQRSER